MVTARVSALSRLPTRCILTDESHIVRSSLIGIWVREVCAARKSIHLYPCLAWEATRSVGTKYPSLRYPECPEGMLGFYRRIDPQGLSV